MAAITRIEPFGPYPTLDASNNVTDDLKFTFTSVTTAAGGGDTIGYSQSLLLVFHNTDSVDRNFTIVSSALDTQKRYADIGPYTLAAGEYAAFLISNSDGWADGSSNINVESDDTAIEVAAFLIA